MTWQIVGKVTRLSQKFIYVLEEGKEADGDDYPVHCTQPSKFRIGQKVLIREVVEPLGPA